MRKRLLIVIGIVCLVGATLAVLATTQHLRILAEGFEDPSFCVISDTINCDLVSGSTYSELWGIPVSWWGTIYYTLLALMCFFAAFSQKERRATVSIAWFMTLAGIPYCIALAYIAVVVLGAICIECFGMYAVTFFAAIALFFALKIPVRRAVPYILDYAVASFGGKNRLGFKHAAWKHVIIIGIVFGIGWIAMLQIQSEETGSYRSKASPDELLRAHYAQPAYPVDVQPNWIVWGNPQAKVKLVEFSEFQCPFCRVSAFTVKPYLHQFRNDIAYYFVAYPLDSSCNPAVSQPMHPLACYLARASICAKKFGDFWGYHDELFRNQKRLSKKLALDIGEKKYGWNRNEFQQCIDSPETERELSAEIAAGQRVRLKGTPSLFLDGRRIKDWRNKKFLQMLIGKEIDRMEKD